MAWGWGCSPAPLGVTDPPVTLSTAAIDLVSVEAIIEVEAVEVEDLTRHVLDFVEDGEVSHGSFG